MTSTELLKAYVYNTPVVVEQKRMLSNLGVRVCSETYFCAALALVGVSPEMVFAERREVTSWRCWSSSGRLLAGIAEQLREVATWRC